jgi:peptide deformylase
VKFLTKNKKQLLEILKEPHDKLRSPNSDIEASWFRESWLITLASNMVHTMNRVRGCGLAAPQIGENMRMFVALIDRHPLTLINPQIVEHADGYVHMEESCLSCPNEAVRISRYEWVEVRYYSLNGKEHHALFGGINAVIIQHELDHLRGKLIVDYKNADTSV